MDRDLHVASNINAMSDSYWTKRRKVEKQVNQHLQGIEILEQVKVGGQSSLSQQEQTIAVVNVDFTTGIELAEE